MQIPQIYTPKAVMLITKIKRHLAMSGTGDRIESWQYEDVCALCEGYDDPEIQECLALLRKEVTQHSAPNVWAM